MASRQSWSDMYLQGSTMNPWSHLAFLVGNALVAPTFVALLARIWRAEAGRGASLGPAVAADKIQPKHPSGKVTRIGVILVHGIGEQRRFEHLDGQMRGLIRALHSLKECGTVQQVSVDISPAGGAAFAAQQDTWRSGKDPSITVTVDHTLNKQEPPVRARLMVHEVWWADANEPYSLAKQVRFWFWGLGVWAIPERPNASALGTANRVVPPVVLYRSWAWDRLRLWLVGAFLMLLGYSIGAVSFLLSRLLNVQMPSMLRTLANYISAVKLYNQQRRFGPGLFWKREESLDSIDEPPRVSVRRRMIRAIADVATNRYDRWYILAHSQGTVVAFNGLMETAYAWPGYLDAERWKRLKGRAMAGPLKPNAAPPSPPFLPRRPGWAQPNEIAYRTRIFSRFSGFLTYGSPLQKFAGLWPALVPVSREKRTFSPGVSWINVYDRTDPVSGKLNAFAGRPADCCPSPIDYGYASHWMLLVSHLNYLTHRRLPRPPTMPDDLATRTVRWLLTNNTTQFVPTPTSGGWRNGTWYNAASGVEWRRWALSWAWWIMFAIALAGLGTVVVPVVGKAAWRAAEVTRSAIEQIFAGR
jgi:hypothetical protein